MNINSLKAKRADYYDLLKGLLEKAVDGEGEPRELTDDEQDDVNAYKSQIATIDRRIAQAEELEQMRGKAAKPVKANADDESDDCECRLE